jgi:hypothetical protein
METVNTADHTTNRTVHAVMMKQPILHIPAIYLSVESHEFSDESQITQLCL